MRLARQLYDLQQIDLDLEQKKEALRRIEVQLGENRALIQAKEAWEKEQQALIVLGKEQRAVEWEIEDIQAKLSVSEKKLYGGSIKNPRELLGLQQEVELLKAKKGEKEDKLLEIMSQIEEQQKKVERAKEELKLLEVQWQERQSCLLGERAKLQELLSQGEQRRQICTTAIDPANLELYRTLREKRQGKAIAKIEQGRCQGCHLSLPMSDLQQARSGEQLARCSSCGRILYLPT